MLRLPRLLAVALPAVMALGVSTAPSAQAGSGCSGLCSVYGWIDTTAQRFSPCGNVSVCYTIQWNPTVQASALEPGSYVAATGANFNTATCSFISPVMFSCSTSNGGWSTTVAPNTTTCFDYSSALRNLGTLVATDSGRVCRAVGS